MNMGLECQASLMSRRGILCLSLRSAFCVVAASAGLTACTAPMGSGDDCVVVSRSAGPRVVGGRTLVCGSDDVGNADQQTYFEDHLLENGFW